MIALKRNNDQTWGKSFFDAAATHVNAPSGEESI